MIDMTAFIPAALYARVNRDCMDMDLSVAAQIRDYAGKNG